MVLGQSASSGDPACGCAGPAREHSTEMRRGSAEQRRARQVGSDALLLWLALAPLTVAAQPAPAPEPPPAAARVQVPEVSDPMLAPAPAAGQEIRSWEQALRMVRAQAPDYLANYQRVRQAEARSRIALGRALPVLTARARSRTSS